MTEDEKTPEADETAEAPNAEPQAPAAAEETVEETVSAAAADDAPAEEPAAEPEAPAEPVAEEAPAEEAEAPAKPKRTRAKKAAPKADAEAEETDESPAADAVADEPEAEEAPAKKPRRSRAKKTEEPPAEEAKPKAEPKRTNGDRPVVRAQAKYVRTSARKARLVCDHIRGKSVDEARAILAHTPRAVSEDWIKLLESAVANAEHNHELLGDDLKIHKVFADEGPTLKRFRPRAMGRATRIRKRTSHLTIQLTTKE
jgi:ribosomal protein L22